MRKPPLTRKQMLEMMQADAVQPGDGPTFYDCAHWLPDGISANWINAIEAIDKRGDKNPLVALLRAEPPSPIICGYLADLIDRQVGKRRKGPKKAAYDPPMASSLMLAFEELRERGAGVSVKKAAPEIARRHGLDVKKLINAFARGSAK
jgi:hypothetical protein